MSDKLVVSLNLMQHAVNKWKEAAEHLSHAAARTFNVDITEVQAGAFGLTMDKYRPAPGYFLDRMLEGQTVFSDIAQVLQYAHDTYEAEDQAGKHALDGKAGEL
ncbi:hypothetical protein ACQP1G_43835 [Nocardia sp. CA-107356]|uniref:hypothetical protein n=1 Tax=Nocardia sp. CA-107356 TaxID=3239972 RepID=UPI003D8C9C79